MHPLVEALLGERRPRREWAAAARHAAAWAGALALAVSVASFAPEAAFVWSLAGAGGGGGGGAGACAAGTVRVPLDGGGERVCVPMRMAVRSGVDLLVPPAFAGLAVGASACFVKALAIGRRHDESLASCQHSSFLILSSSSATSRMDGLFSPDISRHSFASAANISSTSAVTSPLIPASTSRSIPPPPLLAAARKCAARLRSASGAARTSALRRVSSSRSTTPKL
ncbi:hypothetical protein U9M48_037067 [Paspalum notatum var. saurae]|uniref:Uncharacterized protein n=1 Tax=Paspalum notatum var. saurae TaxID=547442 RepID=A0AAQ3XA77_PASNO